MSIKEIGKKAVIFFTSAIFGGVAVVAALKLSPTFRAKLNGEMDQRQLDEQIYDDIFKKQESIRHQFDSLFNDDFVAQSDPLEEMKKMRKQMQRHMDGFDGQKTSRSNPFDSWFSDKFGGGSINDISKREDDNYVYYDIKVDDMNSTSINTKVEEGYVTVTGTVEKKLGTEAKGDGYSAESVFKSSFNRSFPLPENIDQNKMQMMTDKDKVILKFPKIRV